MELKPCSLADLSLLKVEFFVCTLPSHYDALIVACKGDFGYGSRGNGDGAYLAAMVKAGLEAWSPSVLVLDFRELKYEWGDMMMGVLCAGDDNYPEAVSRTVVVVSDLCRKGLTSLIKMEMPGRQKAKDWLFDSLEAAVSELDARLKKLESAYKAPPKPWWTLW